MENGQSPEALLQQGLCLHLAGEVGDAENFYREVLQRCPGHADALYLLSDLAQQAGDFRQASVLLEQARQADPSNPLYHLALGDALAGAGSPEEAIPHYLDALSLDPNLAEARLNLGAVLLALGRLDEAEGCFLEALRANPKLAEAHNNLGNAFKARGKAAEAEAHYRQALDIDGGFAEARINLGNLLRERGEVDEARMHYEHALATTSSDCLRIKMATLMPPVYDSLDDMRLRRDKLMDQLAALEQELLTPGDPLKGGGANNFYLVYQGQDDRDIQERIARLYRRVYQPAHRVAGHAPTRDGRLKIGFVSSFFRDHTIGELNRGIIANLSRERFEVSVFSIGCFDDPVAAFIEQHADHYHAMPNRDLRAMEDFIARQEMDVLLYTDIGMEPVSYFLAFSRLAPVQCVTWGHPVTTGIDTLDYFISSEHQETPDSDRHYSEKLVRLGAIPAYYYSPPQPAQDKGRRDYGLPEDRHLYLCPQSLFKLHPEFDAMIAAILRRDREGMAVLMAGHHPDWTARLKARFARVVPDVAERVVFLPRLGNADYLRVLMLVDVMLDPLHFGGGKTSLDALNLGVPVVTLPGEFMRGRATYACYARMGLMDCVAADKDDYVAKAARLGTDAGHRSTVAENIRQRAHFLQQDIGMVRELERFFLAAVEGCR